MNIRKTLTAVGIVAAGLITFATPAAAHHPTPSSSSSCDEAGTWSATITARADAVRGYTWQLTAPSTSATVADSEPITVTVGPYSGNGPGTVTVAARWFNNGRQVANGSRPVTITRPATDCTPTTTTTAPEVTTTTAPEVTTTTAPEVTTTTAPEVTTTTAPEVTTTTAPEVTTTTAAPSSSTTPPASTTPPSSPSPSTPPPAVEPELPATGSTTPLLVGLALLALAIGGGLTAAARRY
jgi:hypothetical protein